MNTKKIFSEAASLCIMHCALCIIGCSNDDESALAYSSDPNAVHVNATIDSPEQTRLNTLGTGSTWDSGDQIHVTSTNGIDGKNEAAFKYNGSSWDLSGDKYMVWVDGENSFEAYYPYASDDNSSTTSYKAFTLPLDQSDETKLKSADWMTASTTASKPADNQNIELAFKHQMAKVTIEIAGFGEGYGTTPPTLSAPTIYLPTTETGIEGKTISFSNAATAVIPCESVNESGNTTFTAILMPGKYTSGDKFFSLAADGETISASVPSPSELTDYSLESSMLYLFNVTVDNTDEMTINQVSIKGWSDGDDLNGGNTGTAANQMVAINLTTAGSLTAEQMTMAIGNSTQLALSGDVNGNDIITLRDYLINNSKTITKIDLSGTALTALPNHAFFNDDKSISGLAEVVLPATCTTIGEFAFILARTLTSVKGGNIQVLKTGALGYCNQLADIDLSNVTTIESEAFEKCYLLTNGEFDKVTTLKQKAFGYSCFKTLSLPAVTSLPLKMLVKCETLTSLELTAEEFSSVNAGVFEGFSPKNACTLTLNEKQKSKVTVNSDDNTCTWSPVDGTTITLSDCFTTVVCGTETVWTKGN